MEKDLRQQILNPDEGEIRDDSAEVFQEPISFNLLIENPDED